MARKARFEPGSRYFFRLLLSTARAPAASSPSSGAHKIGQIMLERESRLHPCRVASRKP